MSTDGMGHSSVERIPAWSVQGPRVDPQCGMNQAWLYAPVTQQWGGGPGGSDI